MTTKSLQNAVPLENASEICIEHLTKDYGQGKGVFDISLSVKRGEVFGFLGPNGAGKTTTIRNLLGFIRPDAGNCKIRGLDCFSDACRIQEFLGYLAGEIAFPDDFTGRKLLEFIADMKGMTDRSYMNELMERFELNPDGRVKKMSKGMKQKLGIIMAFMNHPSILILDEPTSGLDPLMQNRFVELILEEKKRGTTIFMSSHMFEEIERTCDRTAIIRAGSIVAVETMADFKSKRKKDYILTFPDAEQAAALPKDAFQIRNICENKVTVSPREALPDFLRKLSSYPVVDLDVRTQTLEELFLHFYDRKDDDTRDSDAKADKRAPEQLEQTVNTNEEGGSVL